MKALEGSTKEITMMQWDNRLQNSSLVSRTQYAII